MCEIIITIILIYRGLGSVRPIQQKVKLPSPYKDPKFKVGDYVRLSKYKNIFAEGSVWNWSKEVFIF